MSLKEKNLVRKVRKHYYSFIPKESRKELRKRITEREMIKKICTTTNIKVSDFDTTGLKLSTEEVKIFLWFNDKGKLIGVDGFQKR